VCEQDNFIDLQDSLNPVHLSYPLDNLNPVKKNGLYIVIAFNIKNCIKSPFWCIIPGTFSHKSSKERVPSAKITMAVCSGPWILAKAGLLDGRRATSNKAYFKIATQQSDQVEWVSEALWVEDGPIFTSSGVSAGIDMSLAVIASLFGEEKAMDIAIGTEYVWNQNPDDDPFHKYLNMRVSE